MSSSVFPLPGFQPKPDFAKAINRSERTLERMIARGEVVLAQFGPQALVDIEATAALLRGEKGRGACHGPKSPWKETD